MINFKTGKLTSQCYVSAGCKVVEFVMNLEGWGPFDRVLTGYKSLHCYDLIRALNEQLDNDKIYMAGVNDQALRMSYLRVKSSEQFKKNIKEVTR